MAPNLDDGSRRTAASSSPAPRRPARSPSAPSFVEQRLKSRQRSVAPVSAFRTWSRAVEVIAQPDHVARAMIATDIDIARQRRAAGAVTRPPIAVQVKMRCSTLPLKEYFRVQHRRIRDDLVLRAAHNVSFHRRSIFVALRPPAASAIVDFAVHQPSSCWQRRRRPPMHAGN